MLRDFKWALMVLVALAVILVATPVTSATSATSAEKIGITPNIMFSTYLYQGVTNYHYYYVDPQNDYFVVDLYWGNTANQLKLTIKKPNGGILGTYYDSSDGSVNGRITLRIDDPQPGTWVFLVNGYRVCPTGQGYNLYVA